jgi:[ribosomal protein S5]-alanine N-acetyltransferase
MMLLETITTKRLRGERPQAAHRPFLRALFADAQVASTLWPDALGGPRTPEQVDTLLADDIAHWEGHGFGPWVFTDLRTDTPIGRGGLKLTTVEGRRQVEILYAIRSDRWGAGYATEIAAAALAAARQHDHINEVVAFTLVTNRASQRVMRKIGLHIDREIEHVGLPHVLFRADT